MNRVTITLTIDLPDGVVPSVEYGKAPTQAILGPVSESEEPPHVAEFPPFGYDPDERVAPVVQRDAAPLCQHGIPMKRWPAGVNKAGKPFNPSWRPSDPNCTTKAIWDRDAA